MHILFCLVVILQTPCRWVVALLVCFVTEQPSLAQPTAPPPDSVAALSLPVVTVRAITPERFLAGQKRQRIDASTLLQFRFGSLMDVLAFNTPLAFKNYGPGQLATVSFRGTSASHTAVLWNGININQPNLGQTDFSTLPVAGFDRLSVQYGSSGSVVGSDAVGGSVLLGSLPTWQTGIGVTIGQQMASFRNNQTQAGIRYGGKTGGSWQVSGRTFAWRNQFNNVYPYRERRSYFVEQSRTAQRGLLQDLYARHKNGNQLSVNAWLSDNDLVITPDDTIARERTRTQSARVLTSWETNRLTLRLGWIRDVFDYAKRDFDTPSHTQTDRFIGRAEREFSLTPSHVTSQLILRVGGEWSHYRTREDGYGGQLITENRQDIYALLRWQTARWLLSANVRQAFITRFNPPLTPSLGAEYQLVQHNRFALTAKGAVSGSYRVPTLNERYWRVLGNPDLQPERGFNLEMGVTARFTPLPGLTLTTDATAYRNRVDDWSYWNPDYGYRVENLQLVVARGGELNMALACVRNGWQMGFRVGYARTHSSQERVYSAYANDVVGKQLPYVPVHTGNANLYVQQGQTRLTVQTQAMSRRYTTFDESQFFKGVTLINVLLESSLRYHSTVVRVQGQVNNVFDVLTFSVTRGLLPGRNVSINLLFTRLPNIHEKSVD